MLRQQTWGNRLYFSSFPVPVLEDPTYVGPEDIPRLLGAEGAAASARKIPSWRWGALPREEPGLDSSLPRGGVGGGQSIRLWPWVENSARSSASYLEIAQEVSFIS